MEALEGIKATCNVTVFLWGRNWLGRKDSNLLIIYRQGPPGRAMPAIESATTGICTIKKTQINRS